MRPARKPRQCGEPGCEGKHLAKGLCSKHYGERKRREAGAEPRGAPKACRIEFPATVELHQRFFSLVPEGRRAAFLREALELELEALERATARSRGNAGHPGGGGDRQRAHGPASGTGPFEPIS